MLRTTPALILTLALAAQEPGVEEVSSAPEAIRTAAYVESEAMAALLYLCDRIGPRLTGGERCYRAAHWAKGRFEAHGLETRLEVFSVPRTWRRGSTRVRVVKPVERELAALASGWSPGTDGTVTLTLTTAREGTGAVLVDPISMPLTPMSKHPLPNASFVLVDGQRGHGLVPTGLATWAPPFAVSSVPTAFVAAEDARLLRRLSAVGEVDLEIHLDVEVGEVAPAADVVGELVGADAPNEIVLAIAHLDSWDVGPGAVDDAAGCAVLLEAARILASLPERPKRTIRFALLTGVEQGMGTRGYVDRRDADELARHVGGFAIEGGGGRLLGVMLAGHEDHLARAEAWFAPVRDLGVTDIGFRDSAKKLPLALQEAGVPVFAMVQEAPEWAIVRGTRADTPDKVLELDLMQAACVLAQGLWSWADD